MASGSGTNLQALIDATADGRVAGELALVVTNRPNSGAQHRAEQYDIPLAVVDHQQFPSRRDFEMAITEQLDAHDIDLVVLAGFMRVLTGAFVRRYSGRLINIHPSLLPQFKGRDAVGDALRAGASQTGVTIHFVEEEVDSGAIIAQESLAIVAGDTRQTLLARIHAVEHRLYPQVVDRLLRELR